MPISIARADLAAALTWAARSVPARPLNPALGGLKLVVDEDTNQLTASSFDLDQSSAATLPLDDVGEGGGFTTLVSGRLLVDIVRAVGGRTVELQLKDGHLLVSSDRSRFVLPVMPLDQYPTLPAIPPVFGQVKGEDLSHAARAVCFAASSDMAFPVLTAVQVKASPADKKLTFSATDKFRLATAFIPYEPKGEGTEERSFLIPAKALDGYARTLAKVDQVTLHVEGESDGIFGVTGKGETATTRVYAGDFPNIAPLLTAPYQQGSTINVEDLLGAIKRVSLMAEQERIRLTFTDGVVEVQAGASINVAGNAAASEALDAAFEGEELSLMFNPTYLVSGLSQFGGEEVSVKMNPGSKPVMFTSAEADAFPLTFIAMPLRA